MSTDVRFRAATDADCRAIHALISDNLEAGHLLPRTMDDVARHAARFVVADAGGTVIGCAELAPLSERVAEVRSLVVHPAFRGRQIGGALVDRLARAADSGGFSTLCAFTHAPSHFVRMGFTIVPHVWVPEKVAHDCTTCALFRRCGQYAVTLALKADGCLRPERPPASVAGGRSMPARRPTIERLRLHPVAAADRQPIEERIPA